MWFQKQRASSYQRMISPGQHIYDFLVPEYVELSEQLHHQMMAHAIFSGPDILVEVLAGQISGRRPLAGVPYGRRREVDADTLVPKVRFANEGAHDDGWLPMTTLEVIE